MYASDCRACWGCRASVVVPRQHCSAYGTSLSAKVLTECRKLRTNLRSHWTKPPKTLVLKQEYIPEDKLVEVKRVLYGANRGKPVQKLHLNQDVRDAAAAADFDLQAYKFDARQEQNRKPRNVKIGLIQNSIKAPTTAPYAEQTQVTVHVLFPVFRSVNHAVNSRVHASPAIETTYSCKTLSQ